MTPLMYACQNNRVLLAQLLLIHNADAEIKDIRGWNVSPNVVKVSGIL